jgi:hypothetical protein
MSCHLDDEIRAGKGRFQKVAEIAQAELGFFKIQNTKENCNGVV